MDDDSLTAKSFNKNKNYGLYRYFNICNNSKYINKTEYINKIKRDHTKMLYTPYSGMIYTNALSHIINFLTF